MALYNSADWFSLDPNSQENAINQDFESLVQSTPELQTTDPSVQERYRLAHRQLVEERLSANPDNPKWAEAKQKQQTVNRQGPLTNLFNKGVESHKDSVVRAALIPGAVSGSVDMDWATDASAYFEKKNLAPKIAERKKLDQDITTGMKAWGHSDAFGKAAAAAKMIADVATNPMGFMDVAMESAASMTAGAIGAKTGTLAGTGVAAATGGLATPAIPAFTAAGMFAAMSTDAAQSKFLEKLETRLIEAGIEPTPTNIKVWMDNNPDLVAQDQKDSMVYGGALGAADTVLGGLISRLASAPVRAARQAATRSVDDVTRATLATDAAKLNIPVDQAITQYIENEAAKILAGQSFKSKLGRKALSYTGEVASEPLSEAIGTAAAGDEIKAEDLIYETIGGIGAGPYGAAINTAAFGSKLAADKTKSFAQKILDSTPESRAEEARLKQELEAAKEQAYAPAEHDYKNKITQVDLDGDELKAWSDPANKEQYKPLKAIDAIAAAPELTEDHFDRAKNVADGLFGKIIGSLEEDEQLAEKQKAAETIGDQSTARNIKEQRKQLMAIRETDGETLKLASKRLKALRLKLEQKDQARDIQLISETSTPEDVEKHIIESLGSSGNKRAVDHETLAKIADQAPLNEDQRELVKLTQETAVARRNVATAAKGLEEVADDIYHGDTTTGKFKGIDQYNRVIRDALLSGDTEKAGRHLVDFQKFRDARQERSEFISRITEDHRSGKIKSVPRGTDGVEIDVASLTEADRQTYQQMKKANPNFYIGNGSHKMAMAGEAEVAALNAEVKRAEAAIRVRQGSVDINTATPIEKASETKSAAPVPAAPKVAATTSAAPAKKSLPRGVKMETATFTKRENAEAFLQEHELASEYDIRQTPRGWFGFTPKTVETVAVPAPSSIDYTTKSDAALEKVVAAAAAMRAADQELSPKQEQTLQAVNQEIERRKVEKKSKNDSIHEDSNESITQTEKQQPTEEMNNKPILDDIQNDFDVDLDGLLVTYTDTDGQEKTGPYREIRAELEERLKEAQAILACFG